MHKNPIIIANWKMNGLKAEGLEIIRALGNYARDQKNISEIVICPPFTLLFPIAAALGDLKLGGQDCSAYEKGAHTGDISAMMLKDAGCSHVILGHSERRQGHNEQNEMVREKSSRALEAGLTAIVCVGETLEERKQARALEVIGEQILHSLPKISSPANVIIAYEPVWSIGTGLVPKDSDIAEVAEFIARIAKGVRIIYGGSVKSGNAAEILKLNHIAGLLVGGASLDAGEFWRIINSANIHA